MTSLKLACSAGIVVSCTWRCKFWYSCSKNGRICGASKGSSGFSASDASRIHESFRAVSLPRSQPSCCTRDSSTPWLKGSGTVLKRFTWSICMPRNRVLFTLSNTSTCRKTWFFLTKPWWKNSRLLSSSLRQLSQIAKVLSTTKKQVPACIARRQQPHHWEKGPCWKPPQVYAPSQASWAQS